MKWLTNNPSVPFTVPFTLMGAQIVFWSDIEYSSKKVVSNINRYFATHEDAQMAGSIAITVAAGPVYGPYAAAAWSAYCAEINGGDPYQAATKKGTEGIFFNHFKVRW